jgi:SAM-dependent methyltransferase
MHISAFRPLASSLTNKGLKPFSMERLGMIVTLAGPNGAGKTRILDLLREYASVGGNNRFGIYQNARQTLDSLPQTVAQVEQLPQSNPQRGNLSSWRATILGAQKTVDMTEALVVHPQESQQIRVVNFVPKILALADPSSDPPKVLKEQSLLAQEPGVERLNRAAPSYIQHLQNKFREANHPDFQGASDEKNAVIVSYSDLASLIKKLLKTNLGRTIDGEVTVFDTPLHAQGPRKDVIVTMDEPENHLHPAVLIEVFDRIRTSLFDTQVWLATHSIPLLAYLHSLDSRCIWYVNDGMVSFASKNTEDVLTGLLGDSTQRNRLLQFLELPHQLAALNFASECLTSPAVASYRKGDPQIRQVIAATWNRRADHSIRMLDFGAGKGRLLGGMFEIDSSIAQKLDYVAFDASDSDREDCKAQLDLVYGSNERRWFSSDEELFSAHEKNSFDIVVVCNVLHEIAPDHWTEIFGVSGPLQRALRPDGYALIVEDLRIPVGELPNDRGFFLLDSAHLRTLFDIKDADLTAGRFVIDDARGDGRLKAHLVSTELIRRASAETRNAAIRELLETAKRRMRAARAEPNQTFDVGQNYAFWSQQLANCVLYLEQA